MADQQNESTNAGEMRRIEAKIQKANPEVFKGLPPKKKTEILKVLSILSIERHHAGPLPAPEDLEQYEQLIPNGADRIMHMAECNQQHRHELERLVVKSQLSQSKKGQIFGFIIALSAIATSASTTLMGHEWAGAVIGIGGLTGLVSLFVIGRRRAEKSLKEKG